MRRLGWRLRRRLGRPSPVVRTLLVIPRPLSVELRPPMIPRPPVIPVMDTILPVTGTLPTGSAGCGTWWRKRASRAPSRPGRPRPPLVRTPRGGRPRRRRVASVGPAPGRARSGRRDEYPPGMTRLRAIARISSVRRGTRIIVKDNSEGRIVMKKGQWVTA